MVQWTFMETDAATGFDSPEKLWDWQEGVGGQNH